jgi:hypothetical protein
MSKKFINISRHKIRVVGLFSHTNSKALSPYKGTLTYFDLSNRSFIVLYDDGDEEGDIPKKDVLDMIQLNEKFGNVETPKKRGRKKSSFNDNDVYNNNDFNIVDNKTPKKRGRKKSSFNDNDVYNNNDFNIVDNKKKKNDKINNDENDDRKKGY